MKALCWHGHGDVRMDTGCSRITRVALDPMASEAITSSEVQVMAFSASPRGDRVA